VPPDGSHTPETGPLTRADTASRRVSRVTSALTAGGQIKDHPASRTNSTAAIGPATPDSGPETPAGHPPLAPNMTEDSGTLISRRPAAARIVSLARRAHRGLVAMLKAGDIDLSGVVNWGLLAAAARAPAAMVAGTGIATTLDIHPSVAMANRVLDHQLPLLLLVVVTVAEGRRMVRGTIKRQRLGMVLDMVMAGQLQLVGVLEVQHLAIATGMAMLLLVVLLSVDMALAISMVTVKAIPPLVHMVPALGSTVDLPQVATLQLLQPVGHQARDQDQDPVLLHCAGQGEPLLPALALQRLA